MFLRILQLVLINLDLAKICQMSPCQSELVGDDTKSLIFGKTLMDEAELDWMVTNRMMEKASVRFPKNETTPKPEPHECVVFQD